MRTFLARFFTLLTLAAFAGATCAKTAPVPAAEAKKVRAVIDAQLDAFVADDARRAFSYAAPAIRQMFGTPENFIRMVRTTYPVVYRPASVIFLKPEWVDGELIQGVQMTDSAEEVWLAVYTMQRQRDKSWRISGCQVAKSAGRAV